MSGTYVHGPYSPIVGALLSVAVATALIVVRLYERRGAQPGWYRAWLGVCLLAAIGNYLSFGEFRYGSYMNEWDVTQYYVGTKYTAELGYDRMYEAVWLADRDTGLRSNATEIRDLGTYEMVPTSRIAAQEEAIRSRFSPERWQEFCADVAWLKVQLPAARWSLLTEDHGHNAPPTWTAAMGIMTNLLSIQSAVGRWLMLMVDPLLLVTMLVAVGWAFGLEAAALVGVLLGTHYFFSWGHLKGSIVRTDFVAFAVYAMCLLHKGRGLAAGACASLAACSRAFPVFFLLGPLALLVADLLRTRRVDPLLGRFFVGCGGVAMALVALAVWQFHGIAIFSDWASKMALHMTSHTRWTMGFRTLLNLTLDGPGLANGADWVYTGLEPGESSMLWLVRVLLLLPCLYFVASMRPASAYGAAFVFMFMLVAPVYYYLMVLALPMLYFVMEPSSWSRTLGLSWLLVTGAAGYLLYFGWRPLHDISLFRGHGNTFTTTLYMTSFVAVTVLHLAAHATYTVYHRRRLLRAPAPSPAPSASV